jgi:uroporphyrinogen-III synthase
VPAPLARSARVLVLITRPRAAALALARELEGRGHEALIEPLLTIEPIAGVVPNLAGVQAIVLTSGHALAALGGSDPGRPVFVVGEATAAAARRAGCRDVRTGGGDAGQLARLIARKCRPAAGPLLHLSGTEVRPELAEGLAQAGFALRRQAVYRARAAERLSPAALTALRGGGVGAVLLFSPRSAEILVRLLAAYGLTGCLGRTEAICLSRAVSDRCRELPWKALRVAARPEVSAMVGQLEGHGL